MPPGDVGLRDSGRLAGSLVAGSRATATPMNRCSASESSAARRPAARLALRNLSYCDLAVSRNYLLKLYRNVVAFSTVLLPGRCH